MQQASTSKSTDNVPVENAANVADVADVAMVAEEQNSQSAEGEVANRPLKRKRHTNRNYRHRRSTGNNDSDDDDDGDGDSEPESAQHRLEFPSNVFDYTGSPHTPVSIPLSLELLGVMASSHFIVNSLHRPPHIIRYHRHRHHRPIHMNPRTC